MIGKLENYVNRAIPYAWDDSESWYEFLAKVITKVNELIEMSNDYFDKDLAEYVEQILNAWYDSGKLADIVESALGDAVVRLDAQLAQIMIYPEMFGATGDGVTDDTDALMQAFQLLDGGVTLLLHPQKIYAFSSHLNVDRKSGFTIIGYGSELYDLCKEVPLNNNITTNTPVGISFTNCSGFEILGLENNTAVTQFSEIHFDFNSYRVPQVDFVECSNFTFKESKARGMVGPYIQGESITSYEMMNGGYYRFLDCTDFELMKNEIVKGSGGGEFFQFYGCKNFDFKSGKHISDGASTTFWSFAKIINCENVLFENPDIESISTGSFIDVHGKNIVIKDVHINYPNGKFCDVTAEWDPWLENDVQYGRKIKETTVKVINCSSNSKKGVFSEGLPTVSKFVNVEIDGYVALSEPPSYSGTHGIENFEEAEVKNIKTFFNPFSILNQQGISFLKKINLSDFEFNGINTLEYTGKINVKNGVVKNSHLSIWNKENILEDYDDLSDKPITAVFENVGFEGGYIRLDANVKFVNCTFKNTVISRGSHGIDNPTVILENCDLYIDSIPTPFNAEGTYYIKIILDNSRITGTSSVNSRYLFLMLDDNKDIIIRNNTEINVTNLDGSPFTIFQTNKSSQGNIEMVSSIIKNGNIFNFLDSGAIPDPDDEINFTIENSILDGILSIFETNTVVTKTNMLLSFNRFNDAELSKLLAQESRFKSLRHGGNIEI